MADEVDYLPPLEAGDRLRHFKGGDYTVIAVGTHSETGERMVTYVETDDPSRVWVRPLAMFTQTVRNRELRFTRPHYAPTGADA